MPSSKDQDPSQPETLVPEETTQVVFTGDADTLNKLKQQFAYIDQINKRFLGGESAASQQGKEVEEILAGRSLDIIPHPMNIDYLIELMKISNSLRPNLDSYAANIDGHGHRFVPHVVLESDTIDDVLKANIAIDRQLDSFDTISQKDIDALKKQIQEQEIIERTRLRATFDSLPRDTSFVTLREQTRHDYELTGNAYWEVLRNRSNKITQVVKMQPQYIYLTPQDADATSVDVEVRVSDLKTKKQTISRQFRRFVQEVQGRNRVYFKEFGDPRIISRKTGKAYKTLADLKKKEKHEFQANEVIHFRLYNLSSVYGIPRWIGTYLSILGSRYAEQVNVDYFENKSIPPMVVTVSGGRMTEEAIARIQDHVKDQVRGVENYHKILVLEAESAEFTASGSDNTGRVKIDIQPLTQSIHNDALFQAYDKENIQKVGQAFRLPPLLRGDSRDFNRACYDQETETLTEYGWRRLSELTPDQKIAAYDPKTDTIEYVTPADLLVYDVKDEELLHFKNKNIDCMVTDNHTMLAKPVRSSEEFKSIEAKDIPWDNYVLKTVSSHTRTNAVCNFPGSYIFASAAYIVAGRYVKAKNHIVIGMLGPKARYVHEELLKAGIQHTMHVPVQSKTILLTITDTKFLDFVKNDLAKEMVRLDGDQARSLVQWIISLHGRAPFVYRKSDKELVTALHTTALHAGYNSPIAPEGLGVYRTRISVGRDRTYQGAPEKVRYTGKVYCFSVPGYGFFVTRRNGKTTIQGNTATAVLKFTEQQIFASNRRAFDDIINRTLIPAMGIKLHKFVSNSPATTDPIDQATMVQILSKTGALTPRDLRTIVEEILNIDLKTVKDQPWLDAPYVFASTQWGASFVNRPDGGPVVTLDQNGQVTDGGGRPVDPDSDDDEDEDGGQKSEIEKMMGDVVRASEDDVEAEIQKIPYEIWKTLVDPSNDK